MKYFNLKLICAFLAFVSLSLISRAEGEDYEHLIMYGQSLSTGWEATPNLSVENVPGNYMFGDQIWINYGNSVQTPDINPLIGTPSKQGINTECPLFGTANHIQLKVPGNYIATSTGFDGKSIEELSKEFSSATKYYTSGFTIALRRGLRAKNALSINIHCPAIFWLQGEWNYQSYGSGINPGTTPVFNKDGYKELMVKLKNNMQSDIKVEYGQNDDPLFITYQVGAAYTKGRELTIGMAQLEASNEYKDIVCAGPVYPMTDINNGHLDSNGYRWYGEMLGKVYYKTKILGEDFKPLQPKKIYRDPSNNSKIIVQFLVPKMPLVLDDKTLKKENNYGFQVFCNNLTRSIIKVEIVDDCAIITCASSMQLTDKIEIVYAGENTGGNGNLRDSDDYEALFNYVDLKTKGGTRPPFEPKDEGGHIIYDKPYPLYNFSVAFYYAIQAGEAEYEVPDLKGYNSAIQKIENDEIFIRQSGLNLQVRTSNSEEIQIRMINLSGQLVTDLGKHNTTPNSINEYSLANLSNGMYIAQVISGNRIKAEKIMINR